MSDHSTTTKPFGSAIHRKCNLKENRGNKKGNFQGIAGVTRGWRVVGFLEIGSKSFMDDP